MKYQLRLLDQNLPGLAREIATACWHAVDGTVPVRIGDGLYRTLCRSVRSVFRDRVQAFRYCGATHTCENDIPRKELSRAPAHELFAGEHVHVYLMESPPEVLAQDLLQKTLRAAVAQLPGRRLKGLAEVLKNEIGKALEGRVYWAGLCGDKAICHANEAYDPWDLADPINQLRPAVR